MRNCATSQVKTWSLGGGTWNQSSCSCKNCRKDIKRSHKESQHSQRDTICLCPKAQHEPGQWYQIHGWCSDGREEAEGNCWTGKETERLNCYFNILSTDNLINLNSLLVVRIRCKNKINSSIRTRYLLILRKNVRNSYIAFKRRVFA